MTCQPVGDLISITCGFDGMTVSVDECVFTDGNEEVVIGYSEDPNCQSTNETGILTVSTALDGCGVSHSAGDGVILFSNTLSVFDRTSQNGIITG